MDNFSITPEVCNECDVSSGFHSRSTSPLQSIHKVVKLNCAHWLVSPCMPIKRIEKNRTFLGKQCGERSAVIVRRSQKFCLVKVAHQKQTQTTDRQSAQLLNQHLWSSQKQTLQEPLWTSQRLVRSCSWMFFCSCAGDSVSWSQVSTFVAKATVDFKVGSLV